MKIVLLLFIEQSVIKKNYNNIITTSWIVYVIDIVKYFITWLFDCLIFFW